MDSDDEVFNKFIYVADGNDENLSSKQPKTTKAQFETMKSFARDYDEVTTQREKYDGLWNTLADELNELGPPVRNVMEWRRVWSVYKYNQKRKQTGSINVSTKRSSYAGQNQNDTTEDGLKLPSNILRPVDSNPVIQPPVSSHTVRLSPYTQSSIIPSTVASSNSNQSRVLSYTVRESIKTSNIPPSTVPCSSSDQVLEKLDEILKVLIEIRNITSKPS